MDIKKAKSFIDIEERFGVYDDSFPLQKRNAGWMMRICQALSK